MSLCFCFNPKTNLSPGCSRKLAVPRQRTECVYVDLCLYWLWCLFGLRSQWLSSQYLAYIMHSCNDNRMFTPLGFRVSNSHKRRGEDSQLKCCSCEQWKHKLTEGIVPMVNNASTQTRLRLACLWNLTRNQFWKILALYQGIVGQVVHHCFVFFSTLQYLNVGPQFPFMFSQIIDQSRKKREKKDCSKWRVKLYLHSTFQVCQFLKVFHVYHIRTRLNV